MHKKFFVLVVAIGLVTVGMGFGQNQQTFNFECTVEPYIEVNPTFAVINASRTIHGYGTGAPPHSRNYGTYWDAVYSNSRFTVSFEGENDAGDNLPILAMKEPGASTRYDRLQTIISIRPIINWGGPDTEYREVEFHYTGWWPGTTLTFNNTPHDGEIAIGLYFNAGLPHKSPDFGVDNTWDQSADAGLYTCTVVATYAVI